MVLLQKHWSINSSPFIDHVNQLSYSQEPATEHYPEPVESNPHSGTTFI
jgi:hypothetical protein